MDNLKIGARQLSENEARLILPTYDEIFTQINILRPALAANGNCKSKAENNIQKTNNIGILGCRGAGKTSLLKTIINKIEIDLKNESNIILPIIIPENMSTSSTLMATILGLFKKEVEKIEKDKKEITNKNCISQNDLKKKYTEVIKQYTFIQKEYRDILINEFTTENEYVKKSNEIFNSDIEFITKFNEFIEEIVLCKGEDTLIFFFIDDIDLSTSRCTDVIKTLLSYISHKNIITFISGDLDTFEEALTIDFLRQENALTSQVWEGEFVEGITLIDRKKTLAYEYLKKVIPPVYRHTIKRWSLEDRGNYIIESDDINKKNDNLAKLLIKTLSGYINPSLFTFINYKTDSGEIEEHLHYTYHLFDDTSRGINNVYNVLSLINSRRKDNKEITFSDKKILIETIAASKPVFNKFRERLFVNIINFGSNEKSTIIRFDNLKSMIDKDQKKQNFKAIEKKMLSDVEKFQLFIFVDFVAKLIGYNDKISEKKISSYTEVKTEIINILIKNPEISGSSYIMKNTDDIVEQTIHKGKNTSITLLSNFLLKSEWEFALAFYKNLSMESYEIIPKQHNNDSSKAEESNILQDYIWKLYLSLKSSSELQKIEIKEYISKIYDDFTGEFAYIQDSLSIDEGRNTVEIIYRNIVVLDIIDESQTNDLLRLVNNFIYATFRNKIFDSNNRIKNFDFHEYPSLDIDSSERFSIIYNIDKNNLWNHSMASPVKTYIQGTINMLIKRMFNEENKSINIKMFNEGSYNKFKKINKGSSNTLAKQLNQILTKDLSKSEKLDCNHIDFSIWFGIKKAVSDLAYNNRVQYGQYEAQNMLNELNSAYPEFKDVKYELTNTDELERLLHYFAIYTIKEKEMESVYLQSSHLSKFINDISDSQGQVNNKMIADFMKAINTDIDDEIDSEQFEKLFISRSSKNVK